MGKPGGRPGSCGIPAIVLDGGSGIPLERRRENIFSFAELVLRGDTDRRALYDNGLLLRSRPSSEAFDAGRRGGDISGWRLYNLWLETIFRRDSFGEG